MNGTYVLAGVVVAVLLIVVIVTVCCMCVGRVRQIEGLEAGPSQAAGTSIQLAVDTLKPNSQSNISTVVNQSSGEVISAPSSLPQFSDTVISTSGLTDSATTSGSTSVATAQSAPSGSFANQTNTGNASNAAVVQPIEPGTSVIANVPDIASNTIDLSPEAIAAAAIAATAGACLPQDSNGWGKPGGPRGSVLNSPCAQPPDFEILDKTLSTCDNYTGSSIVNSCLIQCCQNCSVDQGKYDPTWYRMCRAGCTLCCNYESDPHFAKHGTCYSYVHAAPGNVRANEDIGMYTPLNWKGYIPAFKGSMKTNLKR